MSKEIRCPKCNNRLTPKDKVCPMCDYKLPKQKKDSIDPFPSIIETPNKIVTSESLESTTEIKLKPIPLKVKPVVEHKEEIIEKTQPKKKKAPKEKEVKVKVKEEKTPQVKQEVINTEIETLEPLETLPKKEESKKIKKEKVKKESSSKITFFGILKSFLVIILVCINIYLLANIIINYKNEPKVEQKVEVTKPKKEPQATTEIIGKWQSSNNGLFVFDDNSTFYWYEYSDDLENNYYSGTYNYKKGKEALIEMGYNETDFVKTFGTDIKIENVYSMNLVPKYVYKAYMDVTSSELSKDESWWYLLMIKDNGTAIAYNKTLDLRYNLKIAE